MSKLEELRQDIEKHVENPTIRRALLHLLESSKVSKQK